MEVAFTAVEPKCRLLIAGQLFEVDLLRMCQYRVSHPHVTRRIKRDLGTSTQKKGICGIRFGVAGVGAMDDVDSDSPGTLPSSSS